MSLNKLSVVVPVFNEEGNVNQLFYEIKKVCSSMMSEGNIKDYEVIIVNDGSRDRTQVFLEKIKSNEKKLKIILLRKNFGQTPALKAGFDNATGDVIVTMDGDLQNDPKDIPALLAKLNEGYDVVSGWRHNRKDRFGKKFSSMIMNKLRKTLIGDSIHDYGCSLKAYRKECIKDLQMFGELHRYITAYLHIKGYKIGEVKTNHRPRKSGQTKYGFSRGINGILDLVFLKYWQNFSHRCLR